MQLTHLPRLFVVLLALTLVSVSLRAQQVDETYNEKIKEYTTDPRFLPASVLNLLNDPKIPSPRKHFGQIIGTPGVLHRTSDIYAYFQKLTQTSPCVTMQQVGTSEEGRPMQLVVIGNEEAIKRLDHYKKQLALLADPRKMQPQDLPKILGDAN